MRFPSSMSLCMASNRLPLDRLSHAGFLASKTSSISSKVFPFVSGAAKKTWMKARILKVPKIIYIFQLILHNNGGTAKPMAQFHIQFEAVVSETALARMPEGNISEA